MERVIAMVSMISVMQMVDKEQASDKENSTGLLEIFGDLGASREGCVVGVRYLWLLRITPSHIKKIVWRCKVLHGSGV